MSFADANPHPRIEPFDRLDTVVSYFIGNEPEKWRPDVPVWGGVRYVDLYPGVDLEITDEGGQMVQRLDARPEADLATVRLRVEGADAVAVDGDSLRLSTTAGEYALPLLLAAGPSGEAAVQLRSAQVFDVAAPYVQTHPNRLPATIHVQHLHSTQMQASPVDNSADLLYGSYLGGSNNDYGYGSAVNGAGRVHVTGATNSSDFPITPSAIDPIYNGGENDAFWARLDPAGSAPPYASFLGGSRHEEGYDLVVDGAGSIYLAGNTYSTDFPTTPGGFDTSLNNADVFVAKLSPAGTGLVYATFLGGKDGEWNPAIAVDGAGRVYATGDTTSYDFPTTPGAFDRSYNGYFGYFGDAFVIVLNPDGRGLTYGTYLGGGNYDFGNAVAVDGTGNAYVAGSAQNSFPTTPGAFDQSYNGGTFDAFVAKLNPTGSALVYSTFLGGNGEDGGAAIAVDEAGNAYVTGGTASSDFRTPPGGFAIKLNSTGNGLAYVTFLGGCSGSGIAMDAGGRAYIAGSIASGDLPTTLGAFDRSYNGGNFDACVVRLGPAGAITYATFLGGSGDDWSSDIAVDGAGHAYVAGSTNSASFPTTSGTFDTSYNGGSDAFAVKLALADAPPTYTISGRVTDASGTTGIPGVTVWAGFPRATTTDGNGNYTFAGLSAGAYVLTPEMADYTFFPLSRTVTVPPNPAYLNFRGEQGIDFRPKPDGYVFKNWGRYPPPPENGDFTPDDMVRMFGKDAVCQSTSGACVLTFGATIWLDFANRGLNSGRCFGMATTSLRFFKVMGGAGENQPSDFQAGAQTTYELILEKNRQHIAYYQVMQGTSPLSERIRHQRESNPPSSVLEQLRTALEGSAPDPMVLILKDTKVTLPDLIKIRAHALVPYALRQQDENTWLVRVYDNNYPNNEDLSLTIDTTTETWHYFDYDGDSTRDALAVVPASWLDIPPTCPVCRVGVSAASGSPSGQVWHVGLGNLLVTDSAGRRLGYVGDQRLNEIPNAYDTTIAGGLGNDTTTLYTLPLTDTYRITVTGNGLTTTTTTDLAQFGPGYAVTLEDLAVNSTTNDEVSIVGDGSRAVYRASGDKQATLTLAQDGANESHQFSLREVELHASQSITLTNEVNAGRLAFANSREASNSYDLAITRATGATGMKRFYHADLTAVPGDVQSFDYRAWDGAGPLVMRIDHNGDGSVDETRLLQNQIKTIYLPLISRK